MMGCLACKSCAGQCPIKVNVPDFRARFLELYYGRYLRPVKDYIVGGLEFMIPWLARFPAPYNWAVGNRIIAKLMRRYLGMVNSPAISTHTLKGGLEQRTLPLASIDAIESLTQNERDAAVIIVQDAFTSYFESQLVLDLVDLLRKLDFTVLVAPYRPNGKPLHIHGFLQAFENTARQNAQMLAELATTGVPLVGIDPSITLTYREEYRKIKDAEVVNVMLIQEWLAQQREILTTHGKNCCRTTSNCSPTVPNGHQRCRRFVTGNRYSRRLGNSSKRWQLGVVVWLAPLVTKQTIWKPQRKYIS
ncbi:(Fe-S)-binding protein [endosymbiont of Tevnia jerichonana]|uniref:sn-glycerol-3-phosphate dehydrogenase, subunit C GlpC n=1 Tax=endosymbiont of Tevnia jerichonana (vent Tica) TaxID=1049564 RepID=G2FHY4_9GAMM|nr:sn-glycerol-3-phosphate dehydrogenase, subunit C GlpC [endosymbiont of Tevnia jerichonana (vent Tica)]